MQLSCFTVAGGIVVSIEQAECPNFEFSSDISLLVGELHLAADSARQDAVACQKCSCFFLSGLTLKLFRNAWAPRKAGLRDPFFVLAAQKSVRLPFLDNDHFLDNGSNSSEVC